MPELGFHDQSSSPSSSSSAAAAATRRSGFRARDASPDSVIFTLESNLSLFSSASASVDRCSFASDAHDRDSLVSEISLQIGGGDSEQQESSSGPDLDPNKQAFQINRQRKGEKVKVLKDESDVDLALDSARSSFSLAIKECQDRRARSDAFSKKLDRRRPASLDLNNVIAATASSPRLGSIKKSPLTSRKSGNFPSPGTPNYRHASVGMQKGWSSERVPLPYNNGRKQGNALLLNGKTLPSKWEDAERWIFSPISGDGTVRSSYQQQPQRRPKSKSGPLGPPGVAYYSLYSPAMPMFDGGNVGNFMPPSPFSAGVMAADGLAIRPFGHGGAFPTRAEPCMARSVSVHGCSEMLSQSSTTFPQGDFDEVKDTGGIVSRAVSRRDMATQMSPESSSSSSPKIGPSYIDATTSIPPIVELENGPCCRLEVRDVQVDERVTMTRWSKKNRSRIQGKGSDMFENLKKRDAGSPTWDISDTSKSLSKVKREEAKIIAWENLQKAKAEAAIRKLEMKLEKKRSSSMDKIMKKLRSAQKRAQEMRSSAVTNEADQAGSHKIVSFHRGKQMSSLSGCFTCHAF